MLRNLRLHVIKEEIHIHNEIKSLLEKNHVDFTYEKKLGKGNRIDFLLDNGIGIEVKKGKPNRTQVMKQLDRYSSFDSINETILVIERSIDLPNEINGKRCSVIALNKLWF